MRRGILFAVLCLTLPASLALASAPAKSADPNASEGKKLFEQHCSTCHYADRTTMKVGPGLKGLFQHKTLKTGAPVTESNVRSLIENGHDGMPSWKSVLSKAQIDDIMAYLKTL